MRYLILDKKAAKLIEPISTRWENILQHPHNRKLTMMWMDILMVAKDEALIKAFGKPLYQVQYTNRNKVWGIAFNDYPCIIYREKRGTVMQVHPNMPAKQILALIKDLHTFWKSDIKKARAFYNLPPR